jgi:hypothetical protein
MNNAFGFIEDITHSHRAHVSSGKLEPHRLHPMSHKQATGAGVFATPLHRQAASHGAVEGIPPVDNGNAGGYAIPQWLKYVAIAGVVYYVVMRE